MPHAQEQHTVQVRVQVVAMQSYTLDLVVPTYLPARDLTQRIARDAGLDSYWEDGRRRLYWLRARGRLIQDHEDLADMNVVPGELVYLLPEPPAGSGVLEQDPDYPETRGYLGRGIPALLVSVALTVSWSVGWGLALGLERTVLVTLLPGVGLGLLCSSLSRHLWGGEANRIRVAVTAVLLFLLFVTLTFTVPRFTSGTEFAILYRESVAGLVAGLGSVLLGWLAWWGPVEPLPAADDKPMEQQAQAVATVPCAICGGSVTPDVRQECPHGCGRYFHVGCYQARLSVYRGDGTRCAICDEVIEGRG